MADAKKAAAPTINYGQFVNTVINFLIVALAVYLLVQQVNRWTKKPVPGATPNKGVSSVRDDNSLQSQEMPLLHGAD